MCIRDSPPSKLSENTTNFGMEVFRAYSTLGLNQPSDVAHMAHLGGFLAAYLLLPLVAKGGP